MVSESYSFHLRLFHLRFFRVCVTVTCLVEQSLNPLLSTLTQPRTVKIHLLACLFHSGKVRIQCAFMSVNPSELKEEEKFNGSFANFFNAFF